MRRTMLHRRTPSFLSMAIAALAVGAAVLATARPWLGLLLAVLWLLAWWLALPPWREVSVPSVPGPEQPGAFTLAEMVRGGQRAVLEPLGLPLLLVDAGRIAVANAAARAALGGHIVGQDARIALRHPEAVRLLSMPGDATLTVAGLTGARSLWRLARHDVGEGRFIIEMADQTTEANIGRAHTDFVANASHELRTPLAAIIGYTETLADGGAPVDAPTTKRFLATILREAMRMLSLVEDLMVLSRVEAEKHDQPAETVDLSGLMARVVAEVTSIAGKDRVVLTKVAPGAFVLGDAGQLEQLLRNLIDNALKYGAPDVPVEVSLARDESGDALRLAVRDHGTGIAPEHLPHLTRRFYRVDAGRSRASGGTGLGLAIVKHIVERHRGELAITSATGEGTEVSVRLPACDGVASGHRRQP